MKKNIWLYITIIFCLIYFISFSLINIERYKQFDLGYYDFGFFDTAIWKVSRFQIPTTDHLVFPGKIIFADHFNPSIFLLSPIYWFTSNSKALLIIEYFFVSLGGIVLYFISKKILKNSFLSFSITFSYLMFIGMQNACYVDFHELTVASFFILMTFFTIFYNKPKLFFIFFILTLGFKESLFLFGIGISIFIYLYKKDWAKIAKFSFLFSIIYALIVFKFIIPYFSGGHYNSAPNIQGNFWEIFLQLFLPLIKIKTVFYSFLSFLFLPLFSPQLLPIIFLNFLHRFLMNGSTRWDLGMHYNAELAPTLAISTILGINNLKKLFKKNYQLFLIIIPFLLILNSLFLHRFIFHGPINLAYDKIFYNQKNNLLFLNELINHVPKNKLIMAQNNLTVPFLHNQVLILRDDYVSFKPDCIVIDARDGQNPSNYLGVKNIKNLVKKILEDKNYSIYFHKNDQYIFKKNNSN